MRYIHPTLPAVFRSLLGSTFLSAVIFLATGTVAYGLTFSLPATTDDQNRLDLGLFPADTQLVVQMSGTIHLVPPDVGQFDTHSDGSLAVPYTGDPEYDYVNAGASYPSLFGGDGINHFIGGGANFDTGSQGSSVEFGFAGVETTDTLDPGTIRFGAVVATFSATPTRADWFFLGASGTLTVPSGGSHLYLAIQESFAVNNSGAYTGELTAIPEPATLTLTGLGLLGYGWLHRRRCGAVRSG